MRFIVYALALGIVVVASYGAYLSWVVTAEFDERGWDVPAQVYAAPLEIYGGRRLSAAAFAVDHITATLTKQ